MATKVLSPHPHALYSFTLPSKLTGRHTYHLHQPWLGRVSTPSRSQRHHLPRLSLQQTIVSSSALMDHLQHYQQNPDSMFFLAETAGYSLSSYYTSLGLFVISVPGLWSLIKRSVKSKVSSSSYNLFLSFLCLIDSIAMPNYVQKVCAKHYMAANWFADSAEDIHRGRS